MMVVYTRFRGRSSVIPGDSEVFWIVDYRTLSCRLLDVGYVMIGGVGALLVAMALYVGSVVAVAHY